ncbi:hypothetical protein DFH09DRAFT_1186365 [Mycena vulgaris]|nr:hypothetical protein DFH09DRAFT_1186365 [Mycena vulgaris]
MSNTQPPQMIMTSPVFRYAVLVVLCVVVIMAAGVCYRTRIYQRRMREFAAANGPRHPPSATHDWGPKPRLFDVYLHTPSEKPEVEWDHIMPISLTRAASMAQTSVMICMPFSRPFVPPEPVPDDERYLPALELGLSDIDLPSLDALRSSSESDGAASKQKGS